ncbi:thiamine ABC transporter substrate-binding protein [Nocardioides ferulae]|uniref:thiamine ABC transporter substrate-binding protein n=1 Tax=Nocardioides ferulae TaxID=2340821 RepID=UPI001F0BF314|nr:thiamine ABC transporter substrate-binding protein [Nocardioides ferulae]
MQRMRPSVAATRRLSAVALTASLALLGACSTMGEDDPPETTPEGSPAPERVVLVTHDSFALPKKLIRAFEAEHGLTLEVRASGDAGTLTNKLVLTQDNPTGDVAFGIDNTFASRAVEADVFAALDVQPPSGAERFVLPGATNDDGDPVLAPVDQANVCVNVDDTWFEREGLAPPETLEDLADPAYEGLFVTPGATTSSPGMAFLLATIAEYGEEWPDYWERLLANGVKITDGWSDAYQVDFTQGGGKGDRPIVLSYDSSPAFTVDGDQTTTSALLDTCFAQVEYAGVLSGAENPDGAQQVVQWLLDEDVQAALPTSMYVFPVDSGVELPEDWARFAEQPSDPATVDPEEITERRDEWLREWSDLITR